MNDELEQPVGGFFGKLIEHPAKNLSDDIESIRESDAVLHSLITDQNSFNYECGHLCIQRHINLKPYDQTRRQRCKKGAIQIGISLCTRKKNKQKKKQGTCISSS